MKLNKLVSTALLSTVLGLSPAVSEARDGVNKDIEETIMPSEVIYQVIGSKIYPIYLKDLPKYSKFDDCRMYKWYKVYFSSNKKNLVPWEEVTKATPELLEEIKNSPQCDIMWKLIKS